MLPPGGRDWHLFPPSFVKHRKKTRPSILSFQMLLMSVVHCDCSANTYTHGEREREREQTCTARALDVWFP